ncbi:NIPSNAP family protein [Mucilaginibacter segetis]|uniref:NIPSNAP family protein n=1 Tax=Mucilaginibacter segetis TaxID=2793071 RepID=A0A934PRE2_9SPHI|nr:NIPSNAP family protein [Mucilaginibacter segetis]MBK0379384.1 NIPSNAP family protein [Mucilaginibacter segetis]
MKRRSFVKGSLLTGAAGITFPGVTKSLENEKDVDYYELRLYTLKNEQQQAIIEEYFKDAAIPALNRMGCKSVGVFTELKPKEQTRIYVLIPYKSLRDFDTIQNKLITDRTYQQKGSAYLNAPASQPAYERIESWLLKAFAHMPKIQIPEKKERIFELRRYEHASENAGKKKLEMFNDAGEIDIFKRLGFNPVFFGETIIGEYRPNLTYMITFDDMTSHDSHWKAFGSDPQWKKISSIPEYADAKLVSKITSVFLKPADCSQI